MCNERRSWLSAILWRRNRENGRTIQSDAFPQRRLCTSQKRPLARSPAIGDQETQVQICDNIENSHTLMATSWDLFFSYRRHDLDRAQRLLNALAQAGVRVWRDQSDIPDQAAITAEIRQGIANSKAFLAFYSRTYPASNPCQQ